MKRWIGFHFLREDCRLGYGDGREVKAGTRLTVRCEPVLCQAGLHASAKATDAVQYAPGQMVTLVKLSGRVVVDDDKMVGTVRTVLAGPVDASRELRLHAVWCAARALKRAKVTDKRSWNELRVAVRHANGKATDEELAAASDAAMDAAWAAARAATRDAGAAARAAALAAARDAWAAARDAGAAAGAAAWAAAWDAARAAAWDAGAAASDAAWAAQERDLSMRLLRLMGCDKEGKPLA